MPTAPTVLLVEDKKLVLEMFKHVLAVFGCEVVGEAASQKDAVALFDARRPALVLLDIRLAIGDGIAALEEILAIDPKAYVVMLTAMDDDATRARCMELGAKGFVAKGRPGADIIDDLAPHIEALSEA